MAEIFLFVIGLVSIIAILVQQFLHQREKKDIFDRFMARNFREYKYFKEDFPIQIEHKKEALEEQRKKDKKPLTPEQQELQERARRY